MYQCSAVSVFHALRSSVETLDRPFVFTCGGTKAAGAEDCAICISSNLRFAGERCVVGFESWVIRVLNEGRLTFVAGGFAAVEPVVGGGWSSPSDDSSSLYPTRLSADILRKECGGVRKQDTSWMSYVVRC